MTRKTRLPGSPRGGFHPRIRSKSPLRRRPTRVESPDSIFLTINLQEFPLNKQKTIRYALAAGVAIAVTIPLVAQVRQAQSARLAAAEEQVAPPAGGLGALGLPPAASQPAVDPNKVIATAGKLTCTSGEFDAVAATVPPQYAAQLAQPAVKKRIADQIIRMKLLSQEAEKRKLDEKPEFKRQLNMQRNELLANALAADLQGSANEQSDKAYFDANKSSFDDVKARHILIRTPESPVPSDPNKRDLSEAEAKAKADQIQKQLQTGGDFAAIAKTESDDKGSGAKGGDLGTFAPWKMDPTFSKALLGLQKNQVSAPIKTQFGYHIIQLLDDTPRTFEQAKADIGQARWSAFLTELGEKDKTNYDPTFFGTPATQPAAAVAPRAAKG
jgi:peptidyl-prolyl cis-trans isomerase C